MNDILRDEHLFRTRYGGGCEMRSMVKVRLAEGRITAREVARRLGVEASTVSRWSSDRGIGSLTLARAERLARVIGCRVADLFEDEGADG